MKEQDKITARDLSKTNVSSVPHEVCKAIIEYLRKEWKTLLRLLTQR